MNETGSKALVFCMIFALIFASCSSGGSNETANSNAETTCKENVCVSVDVIQPITLNQPASIEITLSSTDDKDDLLIVLRASPSNVVFGPESLWEIDLSAGQTVSFTSTVTFNTASGYQISAEVFHDNHPVVLNFEYIEIDANGATVNPTIKPAPTYSKYPVAITPSVELLTPTANPGPLPTDIPLEGLTPQEWLNKCGWTVNQPESMSEWSGINEWLDIPYSVMIGEDTIGTVNVSYKNINNLEETLQVKIGVCAVGQGWTTDSEHEWNATLQSGVPLEIPITIEFTETGMIPIFIVALDTQNNRIAGTGRLIYVINDSE